MWYGDDPFPIRPSKRQILCAWIVCASVLLGLLAISLIVPQEQALEAAVRPQSYLAVAVGEPAPAARLE